ncbi:MAG: methyltransferase domain-containing protein [Hyphomicrobiaceae bacterium]
MRDRNSSPALPSPWVVRFASTMGRGASALDVACGGGRHARWLLSRGFAVTAVDRDFGPVRDLVGEAGLTLIESDLERGDPMPWRQQTFDLVVVTNYLWRPILPAIVSAVSPHGMLIYETFAAGNAALGRPSNPAFLLQPGELLEAVAGSLTPVAFEHVRLSSPERVVQRVCAIASAHPWIEQGAPV